MWNTYIGTNYHSTYHAPYVELLCATSILVVHTWVDGAVCLSMGGGIVYTLHVLIRFEDQSTSGAFVIRFIFLLSAK